MHRKAIPYFFFALFALLPLAYSSNLVESGMLPRLMVLECIIFLWAIAQWKLKSFEFTATNSAFISFATFTLLSTFWAGNPSEALASGTQWIAYAIYFILAGQAFKHQWLKKDAIFKAVLLFAVGTICASLIHFQGGAEDSGAIVITFGHENILSGILVLLTPLLAGAYLHFQKGYFKWVSLIFALAALSMVFFIGARAAILALVCMALFVFSSSYLKSQRFIKFTIGAVLLLSVISGFLGSQLSGTALSDTFDTRTRLWESSVALFQENPMIGVGAGNWKTEYQKYGLDKFGVKLVNGETNVVRPHNDFIWILTEYGIVGAAFWIVFFVGVIRSLPALKENSLTQVVFISIPIGFLILGIFSFPIERIPHTVILLTVLAFLMRNEKPVFTFSSPQWVYVPIALVSIFCLLLVGTRYQSERAVQEARKAFLRKHAQRLISKSEEGFSYWYNLDPTVTPVQYYAGMGYLMSQQPEKALTCFELAETANPYYINALFNKGAALKQINRLEEAKQTYESILNFSEGFHKASVNLAELYLIQQDIENGWRVIERVPYYQMDTDPKYAEVLYRILANRIYQKTVGKYTSKQITAVVENKERILNTYRFCRESGSNQCLDQLLKPFEALNEEPK